MTCAQAKMLSGLQLAFIGDTVHDLMVREELLSRGGRVHDLHLGATKRVNAHAQAQAVAHLLPLLSDEETEIFKRGRNARPHHPSPKSASGGDYSGATGFEALLGYLYLTEQMQRARELYALIPQEETDA